MSETAHVIKKNEQPEARTARLGGDLAAPEEQPQRPSARIPAAQARIDRKGKEPGKRPLQGHVLRGAQTRSSLSPVDVEATAFVADVPLQEPAPAEDDGQGEEEEPAHSAAEWQTLLEEAVEEARAEGYEAGREEGYETGYAEAEAAVRVECDEECAALAEDATHLDTLWKQHIEESEPMLVELALRLAQTLVDAPLSEAVRGASKEAISEAVTALSDTPPLTVTVHPVDYLRLQESGLVERLQQTCEDLQWTSDPDCAEGDWSVASPAGAVRRLRSEVVDTLRRRLDLAPEAPAPNA